MRKQLLFIFFFCALTLLSSAQVPTEFWGMTEKGGAGYGTIFKTDNTGANLQTIYSFPAASGQANGAFPKGTLMQASNGKIYGTTYEGGVNQKGILFELNPSTGQVIKKIDFNGTNGANPVFAPVEVNGKLYGTTSYGGGSANAGIIYEYDLASSALVVKLAFTGTNGRIPGGLLIGSTGKLYGTTQEGGKYQSGVVFEYNRSTGALKVQDFFNNISNVNLTIKRPFGILIEEVPGKLLGIANEKSNKKTVFEYDIAADTIIKRAIYSGAIYGPSSDVLTRTGNGKVIGLNSDGVGPGYQGAIFEFDPISYSYVTKLNFTDSTVNGASPVSSLTKASNGKYYGMNAYGGNKNFGVLYEYDYNTNTFIKKFDFDSIHGAQPNYNSILEYCKSIEVTPQNRSVEVCENKAVTISSGVTSTNCTFKWYKDNVELSTASSKDYNVLSAKSTDMGWYWCKVENGCKTIYTDSIYIKVIPFNVSPCAIIPGITTNPGDTTICAGKNAAFKVVATNASGYQWEVSTNGGTSFASVPVTSPYSGSTSDVLTITGATITMNNYLYRCVVSNISGPSVTSNAGKLIINALPSVIANPTSQVLCSGSTTSISLTSNVSGATFNWTSSAQGGVTGHSAGSGSNIVQLLSGNGTVSYQVIATAKGCVGTHATTLVEVKPLATINTQPLSDTMVCEHSDIKLKIAATNVVTYQWQVNRGQGYVNLSENPPYSNTKSAALSITNIPDSLDYYVFRVVITGACGNSIVSNQSQVMLRDAPNVVAIPSSQTICSGSTTNIQIGSSNAIGSVLEWTASTTQGTVTGYANGTGTAINQLLTGDGTVSYVVTARINSCVGSPTMIPVQVKPFGEIIEDPVDTSVCSGNNVTFSINTKNVVTYQWEINKGNGYFNVPEAQPYSNTKTATLTIANAGDSLNNYFFRVIIVGGCGNTMGSYGAKLTVTKDFFAPSFINCPHDTIIKPGVFVYPTPVATDDCSKNLIVSKIAGLGSGANFPLGTTTETYETTDKAGNKATCSFKVTASPATSVEAINGNKQFAVYPNPAHQVVNVAAKGAIGNYSLTIRDITGKVIMQQYVTASSAPVTLDIKELNKGIYFITIQSEKANQVEKLIVQ